VAGPPSRAIRSPTRPAPTPERLSGANRPPLAATAARLFFPQSRSLGIDLQILSPGLLKKTVYAGSNTPAFEQASDFLLNLAQQRIDAKTIARATQRIGEERLAQRDLQVASWEDLPLIHRDRSPCALVPDLAVVMTDGGRVQILPNKDRPQADKEKAPAETPPPPATPGQPPLLPEGASSAEGKAADEQERSRQRFWREDKVAALLSMSSEVHQSDPCPELPEVFREPLVVLKLAREVGHIKAVPPGEPFQSAGSAEKQQEGKEQEQAEQDQDKRQQRPGRPHVDSRRVLATRQNNDAFGPMVAALAWSLGMMAAQRQAFVGDGADANWSIQQKYFPRFVAIVDFIHVLSYVFAAALAGRSFAAGWEVYQVWIEWVWQGKVEQVLVAMRQRLAELPQGSSDHECVAKSLGYLEGQQGRMDYARYRQEGLPIMSSIIESTVKQIGRRVKGSEKFWSEDGVEAVLQLRADYLSDGEPMEHFWQQRADRMTGLRPYKRKSA
jgi:hypothetical protein